MLSLRSNDALIEGFAIHGYVLVQRELDKCLTLLSNNRRPYVDGFGLWLRHRPCEFF